MNLTEAYQILGLNRDASEEQVKKAFRSKAASLHPDVNKSPDAEEQFKKVNEAFQVIQKGEDEPSIFSGMPSGFGQDFGFNFNFDTFFGRDAYQQQHTQRLAPDIHIEKEISFKDSIFGTSLPISFDRLSACKSCDGAGVILSDEKCPHCNGQGGTKTRKGNMIFATTCQHCRGSGKKLITCTTCNGTASVKTNIKLNVTIPAGVKSGNALRVPGKGHHAENHIYSNLIVRIKVTPDNNFEVIGTDVLVKVDLSLREAVFGCEKEVITLDGNKTVTVPPLTRHNEVLRIPNLGVGRSGVQVCVFQVAYPDNIKEILDTTAVCKTS